MILIHYSGSNKDEYPKYPLEIRRTFRRLNKIAVKIENSLIVEIFPNYDSSNTSIIRVSLITRNFRYTDKTDRFINEEINMVTKQAAVRSRSCTIKYCEVHKRETEAVAQRKETSNRRVFDIAFLLFPFCSSILQLWPGYYFALSAIEREISIKLALMNQSRGSNLEDQIFYGVRKPRIVSRTRQVPTRLASTNCTPNDIHSSNKEHYYAIYFHLCCRHIHTVLGRFIHCTSYFVFWIKSIDKCQTL